MPRGPEGWGRRRRALALGAASIVAASWVVVIPAAVAAGPPSNDDIAGAMAVSPTVTDTRDLTDASLQAGEPQPSCGPVAGTVWYRVEWTAPSTTELRAWTLGSETDTVVAVYSGSPGALTEVACNDDSDHRQEPRSAAVVADGGHRGPLWVQVGGFGSKHNGAATVHFALGQPRNDQRAAAAPVSAFPFHDVIGIGATADPGEDVSTCDGWDRDPAETQTAWYRVTLNHHRHLAVEAGHYAAQVAVFDGDERVACAQPDVGSVFVELEAGGTYDVQMMPYYLEEPFHWSYHGFPGTYRPHPPGVLIRTYAPPGNDDRAAAIALPHPGGSVAGTLLGATAEADEPLGCPTNSYWDYERSVWWSFSTDQPDAVLLTAAADLGQRYYYRASPVVNVYADLGTGRLEPVACSGDQFSSQPGQVSFVPARGVRYLVQTAEADTHEFTLSVERGVTVSEDAVFVQPSATVTIDEHGSPHPEVCVDGRWICVEPS